MPQVIIENSVINSPYREPTRHFKFSDEGITDEIAMKSINHYGDEVMNVYEVR